MQVHRTYCLLSLCTLVLSCGESTTSPVSDAQRATLNDTRTGAPDTGPPPEDTLSNEDTSVLIPDSTTSVPDSGEAVADTATPLPDSVAPPDDTDVALPDPREENTDSNEASTDTVEPATDVAFLSPCEECLASGGTWQPEATACTQDCALQDISCYSSSCPEPCSLESCGSCFGQKDCEEAGCQWNAEGPAMWCSTS